MLPTTKQSSRLGSHTADNLDSQRPVCMSCLQRQIGKTLYVQVQLTKVCQFTTSLISIMGIYLMDVSKGDLVVIVDVSYIL